MASLFGRKKKLILNLPDPEYEVIYLGNVLTSMAKGDADKPLALIWRTYCAKVRPDIRMKLVVCRTGLRASIDQLGITDYWAHRITCCFAPDRYPRVFCWIYKHEGKKMKPELRVHASLCKRADHPTLIVDQLQSRITQALFDYKREKLVRQNWRLSSSSTTAAAAGCQPPVPRRRLLLSTGGRNFRPPMARSKSAPKLQIINEEEEDGRLSYPTLNAEPVPYPQLHQKSTADCYSTLKSSDEFDLYFARDSRFEKNEESNDFYSSNAAGADAQSTNRSAITLLPPQIAQNGVQSRLASRVFDKFQGPPNDRWSSLPLALHRRSNGSPPPEANRDWLPPTPPLRNNDRNSDIFEEVERSKCPNYLVDEAAALASNSDWTGREEDSVSEESGYHEDDKLSTSIPFASNSDDDEIIVSL